MRDFRRYRAFAGAYELALAVYATSAQFPAAERYGLTSQVRRSASSVPANIAEGCGRRTDTEFARFIDVAIGSIVETDCLLMLSRDLGYLDAAAYEALAEQVSIVRRLLYGLAARLRAGPQARSMPGNHGPGPS